MNDSLSFSIFPAAAGVRWERTSSCLTHAELYGVLTDGPRRLTLQHMPAPDLVASGLVDDATMKAHFKFTVTRAERGIREQRYYEKRHYDHFRPMLGPVQLPHLNHVRDYSELRTRENIDRVDRLYECDRGLYENLAAIMANG